jgi:protein disulfide-isomerase-like protein
MTNNVKLKSKIYYNLSVYNCLVNSAKDLIDDSEHDLQNYILQNNEDVQNDEQKDKNNIILFYTEWCGHSRNFMPIWDELVEELNKINFNIKCVKIDCDKDKDKCIKYKVNGFPTVKLIVDNKEIEYTGKRNVESLKEFILKNCK